MKKDSKEYQKLMKRSFVEAVQDQRNRKLYPFLQARREVVEQLDAITPNTEKLAEALEVVLARGSDAVFERDDYTKISIADAQEANKRRSGAQDAVALVTQHLSEVMHRENQAVRDKNKREQALLFR